MKKLKYPINVEGVVIPGQKLGRRLGFATANLDYRIHELKNVKTGVYLADCFLNRQKFNCLIYYGPRHVFGEKKNIFEVYIDKFNQNIYGKKLKVALLYFIRPPRRFKLIKTLTKQLEKDRRTLSETLVVAVDRQDNELGLIDRRTAHLGKGKLHRAISALVFNSKGKLLIQQRSQHKKLWPGYWTNTCCTHPKPGEPPPQAAERRLFQEFGIKAKLQFHHQFVYRFSYQNIGSEYELDHIFIGISDSQPKPDPQEISNWKYISLKQLKKDLKLQPQKYTPWFKLALKRLTPSDIIKI